MNTLFRRSLGIALITLALSACDTLGSSLSLGSRKHQRQPLTATQAGNKPPAVVGLALGGGASKGFAHIGVIKVLEENNIPVKVVTGTSAGALVGSLYASGMNAPRLQREAENLQRADLVDLTLSTSGFIRGEKLQNYINRQVGNRPMQNFPRRFAAVATEFDSGRNVVFRSGNTGQAVRASASIPNVFQPAIINGKRYVDGGLTAPVPVSAARSLGANVVIAVDISAKPARLTQSGFFSYLDQSLNIMSTSALNSELAKADVVIKPQVQHLGAVGGFDEKAHAIKLGEDAARAALPQIRAVLQRYRVQ
ncbi:patatin-like phospholipase family protein [Eikenella sp. S3360]|uniref:Patatin-like phospholipase family protein n=1 Tax=Eikenella glucosivorans TaxID=2766967 RepID=A0ABS0N947_9NEIS|nr:patatin-like phospholipase family protein [Eikenella glucosivorans]MBH5328827.1 patatin-like phospholipase family protein [Eikenella glucosivorans]